MYCIALPGRRLVEQMHRSMCDDNLHVQPDNTIAGTRQELDSTIAALRKNLAEEVTLTFGLVWFGLAWWCTAWFGLTGLGLSWFCLVLFGQACFICVAVWFYSWFGFVRFVLGFGLVWILVRFWLLYWSWVVLMRVFVVSLVIG